MKDAGITSYEYLATTPASKIEQEVINFIARRVAKSPSITGNGIYNYTKLLRLLLNQNKRKDIDWERIGRVTPEYNSTADDEAYYIDQVRLAFEFAKIRGKVTIGLMSGSGMRRGGFVGLNFRHLVTSPRLDRYCIFKVRVHADTEYHTFTTPETRRLIEIYWEQRIRDGEPVSLDSPVIRDAYNPEEPDSVKNVVPANENMISHMMIRILQGCGLRVNIPSDLENGTYAGSIRHEKAGSRLSQVLRDDLHRLGTLRDLHAPFAGSQVKGLENKLLPTKRRRLHSGRKRGCQGLCADDIVSDHQ